MIRRARRKDGATVRVTFALPADGLGPVSVVGDFNGWTPGRHTLVRRTNGTRSVTVDLPSGAHTRFRYLADGGHWFDDPDADAVDPRGGTLRL